MNKQKQIDIKRFLLLLIKKYIPIPEDLIDRYINKATNHYDKKLPFD